MNRARRVIRLRCRVEPGVPDGGQGRAVFVNPGDAVAVAVRSCRVGAVLGETEPALGSPGRLG